MDNKWRWLLWGFPLAFVVFIFALAWLVLVLSLGAISLLNMLIRRGSAVNLASLFYLVPPCTALIAWLLVAAGRWHRAPSRPHSAYPRATKIALS